MASVFLLADAEYSGHVLAGHALFLIGHQAKGQRGGDLPTGSVIGQSDPKPLGLPMPGDDLADPHHV
jgi:hypothetical protein